MRATRHLDRLLPVLALAGCIKMIPPTLVPERASLQIAAPYDATWSAVIEFFAVQHIPIQTLDKASGLIVAEPAAVELKDADRWASCGAIKHGVETPLKLHATNTEASVLVRATDAGSTVRVNVRWTSRNPTDTERPDYVVCATTNVWEGELEQRARISAERSIKRP